MYKLKIKLKKLPKNCQEKKLHQDAMKCCTILIYQKLHFEVFGVKDIEIFAKLKINGPFTRMLAYQFGYIKTGRTLLEEFQKSN